MPGEGTRTPARVWGAVKVPAPQLRVLPCRFSKNRRGTTLCLLILLTLLRPVSCGAPEQKDLQRDRPSALYRARLLRGASDFYSFCKRNGCSPERLGQSAAVTSDMLVKYVQHLYDNRKPYWVAKHAALAMQTVYRQHGPSEASVGLDPDVASGKACAKPHPDATRIPARYLLVWGARGDFPGP